MTWRKAGKLWMMFVTSFQFSSFWRQEQAAHSRTATGVALGNKCSQHCAMWSLAQDQRWREQHVWRGQKDRTSTWAFVAETHAPALPGHGKCWFLARPVVKPIFLSRKSISQFPGNCFCGKYSWGWITLIRIAFLQLIIFKRNWDSAKR